MADNWQELYEALADPSPEFRPAMFWLLNGRLTPERIRDQIRQMHERGCGGFFLHPMGESFRLGDFVQGIEPPYLSDEYFALIRVAVEEADRLGMYAWLYDEGGWPSGTAQGKVIEGHPELCAPVLTIDGPGHVVAQVHVGDRLVRFTVQVQERPNLLDPRTVRRFIELTHERYVEYVGEFFGGAIPGMFTDEPGVPGRVGTAQVPWSGDMLAQFQRRTGHDLEQYLPALFSDEALGVTLADHLDPDQIAAIRCEFCEVWTDMYEEAYWRQLNDWCAAHGLTHTGHVGGEDILSAHASSFGHFFKTTGVLHAPGVDAIWRQIFPDGDNFSFPALASSAMAQRPDTSVPGGEQWNGLVLSESYAVYGFGLTLDQMRWVADYQAVRGVNYIAPMALYYETAGGRVAGTMSHLGEGNPLWDHFEEFADYAATVSAAVRLTQPMVSVAVYFPTEAAWLGGEVTETAWQSLRHLVGGLESRQVGWHFIDARTIEQAAVIDGALDTGGQIYTSVIVPETPVLRSATMARLAELRQRGGRVAFAERVPDMPADLDGVDRFAAAFEALTTGAQKMDIARAHAEMSRDDARGFGGTETSVLGYALSVYLPTPVTPPFTEAEAAEGACLVVPHSEVIRLAELLPWVGGRFELHLGEFMPQVRISSRVAGDGAVHLIQNEATHQVTAPFGIASSSPRLVERWDALAAEPEPIAVLTEVSEIAQFELDLAPGECALLTTRPLDGAPPVIEPGPNWTHLNTTNGADELAIVSEWHITTDGSLERLSGARVDLPSPFTLEPLEKLGLEEFSGTVRYRLAVAVPRAHSRSRLALDLGEVGYVARAWLNGEPLGTSAWPPHIVEITGIAHHGVNELEVEVTNTLANQAMSGEIVAAARDQGWMNVYYERALGFMGESMRSGLIGPVRLLVTADRGDWRWRLDAEGQGE